MIVYVYCPSKRHGLRILAVALGIILLLSMSACVSVSYYSQATVGHLSLLAKRRPIDKVLQDPATSEALKSKLEKILEIRRFATEALSLPDNNSYKSYVDLGRRYVVWNVFATPALSLIPIESCFFIVGCLNYRGYYSESDAMAFAEELRAAGHDVYVGGVAAYSTLGYFNDPVLNTMLVWDDRRTAKLIFHELTHQLLYVKNDTLFNESFATSFADIGLSRWLAHNKDLGDADIISAKEREIAFIDMLLTYQQRLEALYSTDQSTAEKLQQKQRIFDELDVAYQQYKKRWSGYAGYDEWMATDLNNAKLSSIATYHSYDMAFQHMLARAQGNLQAFIALVQQVASLEHDLRHACLTELTSDAMHPCVGQ